MRRIGMAFAILLLIGGVGPAFAATPGPLDGQWFIAHRAYTPSSDKNTYANLVMNLGYNVSVANSQVTAQDSGNSYTVPISFDAKNAQNLDIGWPGSFDLPGIYNIDANNVLTIALSFNGTRPTGYDDTTNYLVVVLTKVTP